MGCEQSAARDKRIETRTDPESPKSSLVKSDMQPSNPQSGDTPATAVCDSTPKEVETPSDTTKIVGPPALPEPPKKEEPAPAPPPQKPEPAPLPTPVDFHPITKNLASGKNRYGPKWLPLLIEDTTDADNQIALAGFAKDVFYRLSDVSKPMGIFGVCPRHADLSIPLAFNKHIVKNRPDFRAFEPMKNAHEGTGLVPKADIRAGRTDPKDVEEDTHLIAASEVRRTYAAVMQACGFDPEQKGSWDFMQRAMPMWMLPVCKEHLLSHHFFAREFLFDRGDMDGHKMGDPLPPKAYNRIISEIDGEVAAKADNSYDRDADVESGLAAARRQRARRIILESLDHWDKLLGMPHEEWMAGSEKISKNFISSVTDVVIMAPCTLTLGHWSQLRSCKRVWGMFFALDNAAEYGHWVMEAQAKNIFRNNFNTGLDEDGTVRMLQFIRHREIRAYFHPTELFKGDIGKKSWDVARVDVAGVRDAINTGNVDVPPLLAVYNCYNAAKSPTADPQQISDPMIVFEYLNFVNNLVQAEAHDEGDENADEAGCMMPVASYGPAIVQEDLNATNENYQVAVKSAKAKGLCADEIKLLVRHEKVFVVKPSFEPLNNGCYVGMNLVNRMVPEYSKWLHSLLVAHPPLASPEDRCAVLPIMEMTLKDMQTPHCCKPVLCCAA